MSKEKQKNKLCNVIFSGCYDRVKPYWLIHVLNTAFDTEIDRRPLIKDLRQNEMHPHEK